MQIKPFRSTALFLTATFAGFGQVVVNSSTNIISGDRSVRLEIHGDQSYSGKSLPTLTVVCSQHGNRKAAPFVALSTDAVIANWMGQGGEGPASLRVTRIRLDEDSKPQFIVWRVSEDFRTLVSGGPGSIGAKFIKERLVRSSKIHIELYVFGANSRVSSFNLSGLQEEYNKHEECKE